MLTSFQYEEVTACLAEYYPIGTVRSLMPLNYPLLDAALATGGNNVWRVDAQLGVFCLKRHRTGKPLSRIQFEQELQEHISQSAANMVPAPMKTIGGSSHFSVGEDWFRLERFVRSQHHSWWRPDWSAEHCRVAGQALRHFHRLAGQFLEHSPVWLPGSGAASGANNGAFVSGFGPLGNSISQALSAALVQARGGLRCANSESCAALLECIEACAELLPRSQPLVCAPDAGAILLVHGDFHPGNLLFVGEELKGIVDFEHVHMEDPLFDLGYAALMFCTDWTAKPDETNSLNDQFLSALLEGYSGGDMKPINADALAKHLVSACILIASWLLARCPLWQANNAMPIDCLQHVIGSWRRSLHQLGC